MRFGCRFQRVNFSPPVSTCLKNSLSPASVPAARAAQLGVRLVALDELMSAADFISVHLPKTAETVGLINDEQV